MVASHSQLAFFDLKYKDRKMNNVFAQVGALIVVLLIASNAQSAGSKVHQRTCEQVADLSLQVMLKHQTSDSGTANSLKLNSNEDWEEKLLTAGVALLAMQEPVSSLSDDKIASIINFGKIMLADCISGQLGPLQAYVGETEAGDKNQPDTTEGFIFKLYEKVYLLEQNASEMDERVYLMEQSAESVRAFRRDTNRLLNELQSQIRNLAYSN